MNDNFEDEPPKGDGQLPPSEFSDPDEFGVLTQEGAERLSRERGFLRRYEEAYLASEERIRGKFRMSHEDALAIVREEHSNRGLSLPEGAAVLTAEGIRRPYTLLLSRPVRALLRQRRLEAGKSRWKWFFESRHG
ncbi:hypothetical protein JCM18899A_52350 [Nocardioides sp. AN3]